MSDQERVRLASFSSIAALAGLLIVIISAHSLFPELVFYSIVLILIGVIVVLVGYMFLWYRTSRYVRMGLRRRKQNILARKYFEDFRDFVDRFASLGEFGGASRGITAVLNSLPKTIPEKENFGVLIRTLYDGFGYILQNPINNLKQTLYNLHFNKSEVNSEILSCLVKEFENYVALHKQLYINLTVSIAREIGLSNLPESVKKQYVDYKDDYNQFIVAYTEFAKKNGKELGIFSQHLQKAYEL